MSRLLSHSLTQLTENAAGNIKCLFLNDGIVQIKAIPVNSQDMCKAQRSDLDLNIILHLNFIQLVCLDPSLIIRFDHLSPSLAAIEWGCNLPGTVPIA